MEGKTMNASRTVDPLTFGWLQTQIIKLNKKADKLGIPQLTLDVREHSFPSCRQTTRFRLIVSACKKGYETPRLDSLGMLGPRRTRA